MEHEIKNSDRVSCFDLNLVEFDPNEEVVNEIRKHPFGLFIIYLTGFFISAIILVTCILGSAWAERAGSNGTRGLSIGLFIVGLVLTILAVIMTFISAYLYTHNVILITNEKLAEMKYTTIFNRSVSQLTLGEVQDVSVEQKGIFARIFGYGTLFIETAGEDSNNDFNFTFTPNPFVHSKEIIAAHEENVRRYGN